jgi:hypothetical protein
MRLLSICIFDVKPHILKITLRTFFLSLLFLFTITGIVAIYLFNKKTSSLHKIAADYQINAQDLYEEFELDENSADEKYKGKILSVAGKIIKVDTLGGYTTLSLEAPHALAYGVNCSFASKLENYSVGDSLVIKGQYIGFLTDVILNNCIVEWPE